MKAYSGDLQERVIRAVEVGRARGDVAARFEVSVPTIERWVRLKRETGGLTRRRVPGSVAVKTAGLREALPERLAGHADAALGGPLLLVAGRVGLRGEHSDDESGQRPTRVDAQKT